MDKLSPEQIEREADTAESSAEIVQTCIREELRKFSGPLEKAAFLFTITEGLFGSCNHVRQAVFPHMTLDGMLETILGLNFDTVKQPHDDEGVLHDEP